MEYINAQHAKVFKAFCDEVRLTILGLLRDGEKCACKLQEALPISKSTLSHHMKILCDSGVVQSRKEGKWTHYSISVEGTTRAGELIKQITNVDPESLIQNCG